MTARLAPLVAFMLMACSGLPGGGTPLEPPGTAACAVVGSPTPEEATLALALRRNVEAGPLFAAAAASEGLAACKVRHQADGILSLEYRFRRGGSLTVTRDARIEYTEQDGRFDLRASDVPEAMLAGTERASFGSNGCGIDWRQPEARPADDDAKIMETIFRGEVCNCQARIRRAADGRVVGLLFRSAC